MYYDIVDTAFGPVLIASDDSGLRHINFQQGKQMYTVQKGWKRNQSALKTVAQQLQAYFAGELRTFDLELAPTGTDFQQRVWKELLKIPYGATITYGEIAINISNPKASRAVGRANGLNPIPIIIPCHRVIGSNGTLTGYAGGLEIKQRLLEMEGAF